jgi:hypothetical protein
LNHSSWAPIKTKRNLCRLKKSIIRLMQTLCSPKMRLQNMR